MRAPLSPLLLAAAWVSAAWFAGGGCAGAPKEESQAAAKERACTNDASDPLHMASSRPYAASDPQIESILNQPADPRLAWVNRQMYQSLHALDVELRREQRVAACEHPESSAPTLEALSGNGAAAGGGAGGGTGPSGGVGATAAGSVGGIGASPPGGTGPSGGTASAAATATIGATPAPNTPAANPAPTTAASAASQNPMVNAAAPGAARATLIRKASLSATGGGGNGATAPKVTAGSDNDIVARRLRKAAEQETNPTLRAKLWKEYTDYRQGMAAK
jgi:hypothetical protein